MLFVTRKKGQSLVINEHIHVHVDSIQGKTVRLAINAPQGSSVLRQEIYDRIKAENIQAQKSVSLLKKVLTPSHDTEADHE